jgi:hypothetical protein
MKKLKQVLLESNAPDEEERGTMRRMLFNLYKNQVISRDVLKEMMDQFEKALEECEADFGEMPE